jgi:tRNA and rRNA cytosine-C5-methylase
MMPHRLRGEGLFLALVRKPSQGEGHATPRPVAKGKGKPTTAKIPEAVKAWLRPEALPSLHWQSPTEGLFVALPQRVAVLTDALRTLRVPILSSGVQVAEAKGRDFLPLPALALSELLDPEAFPAVELTHPEAIRYLAREAITLPEGTPRGFVLVRYRGLALGFVKHLGNRSNNLYPQPWRIRHPEQILSPSGE